VPFTRLEYEKSWKRSEDFPTYEGDETKVREDMQYHPDAVKDFLNDTLMAELEGPGGAGKLGDSQKGTVEQSLAEAFRRLDAADSDIKNLAGGESPESVRAAVVTFTAEGWVEDETGGLYELRILSSQHKRLNDAFGFKLQHLVGEGYRTNSWAIAGTDVGYDRDSGDVILTSSVAYTGAITFFGV